MLKRTAASLGMTFEALSEKLAAGLKRCRTCGSWKPLAVFAADRSRGDGRKTICYTCARVPNPQKPAPPCFKGRRHTPEARALMSAQRIGNKFAVGHRKSEAQLAVVRASAARLRAMRGPANVRWKGGVTPVFHAIRCSPEYKAWRVAVFARDGYSCQRCGDARGGNLHAHHVKPFATHPELRFDVANGLTLCELCHEAEHRKAAHTDDARF
jgi:hypothetical protein